MINRIREVRKSHNMTMKQLGVLIGAAESTVSQYETGKRQPDHETLLKISDALNVTVGYLIGAEEHKKSPVAGSGNEAMEKAGYYKLNDANRSLIDQMIEQLIKSQSGN